MKSRLQRNKEIIMVMLLAFSGLLAVFLPFSARPERNSRTVLAAEDDGTKWPGPITHYNGVVFGSFSSERADVEGALAIGGKYAEFGTQEGYGYDIGAAAQTANAANIIGIYENPEEYPALLLYTEEISIGAKRGETVNGENWYGVYGGRIVIPEGMYAGYRELNPQFNGGHNTWAAETDLPLTASEAILSSWFQDQYTLVTAATEQYVNANEVTISQESFSEGSYLDADPTAYTNQNLVKAGAGETAENILVINVETEAQLKFSDQDCLMPTSADWADAYDLIIYNFPDAQQVSAQGGAYSSHVQGFPAGQINQPYQSLKAEEKVLRISLCSKVVWNFPAAESIIFREFQLYGAVLAPYADFEGNGGSLNGQLICHDFIQNDGFELHAYTLDEIAFELTGSYETDPDGEGEPEGMLFITKNLTAKTENTEQFVFRIAQGEQYFYGILEIEAGEMSGTIQFTGLEYDTYIITECDTNWRYQQTAAGGMKSVRVTAEEQQAAVTFENEKSSTNWLSVQQRLTNKMRNAYLDEGTDE